MLGSSLRDSDVLPLILTERQCPRPLPSSRAQTRDLPNRKRTTPSSSLHAYPSLTISTNATTHRTVHSGTRIMKRSCLVFPSTVSIVFTFVLNDNTPAPSRHRGPSFRERGTRSPKLLGHISCRRFASSRGLIPWTRKRRSIYDRSM